MFGCLTTLLPVGYPEANFLPLDYHPNSAFRDRVGGFGGGEAEICFPPLISRVARYSIAHPLCICFSKGVVAVPSNRGTRLHGHINNARW